MAGAVVFSLMLAYGATAFRGDPIVICIGMNLLASGLTAYLLRVVFGVSGTFSDPRIVGLGKISISRAASRARSRLGLRSAVDAHLGRVGADGSRQRRHVQDAGGLEAARRRAKTRDAAETLGVDVARLPLQRLCSSQER